MPKPTPVDHGATFDLPALDREMRTDPVYERSGHIARTLVRTPDLRVVFMVMAGGSRLSEHKADETAAIHVLSGRIRLALPDRRVDLPAGHLLVLEAGLRHDVEADEDSAFVLTLGWPAEG
ncbi:MAG: cupin domain-containing protein [Myxococcota bacterium]